MQISCFNFTVKQLTTKTDDRAWYEKLEDFEGDFEFVDDGEDGEQGKKNKRYSGAVQVGVVYMIPDYVEFVCLSALNLVGETSRYSVQASNVIQFLLVASEFSFITSIFFSGVQSITLRIDGISMNLC
jgi:hypothetical protein